MMCGDLKVEASGSALIVTMQIGAQGKRGCGGVVEWVITPEVAAAKERDEINRIGAVHSILVATSRASPFLGRMPKYPMCSKRETKR